MTDTFLDLQHVTVMRGERAVLHNISLLIAQSEQVVLLGPNGCGKSTLLKTIACELYPLASPVMQLRLLGKERWDLTMLRQRLGIVQADLPGQPMLAISGEEAVLTGFFSSSKLWPNLLVTEAMRARAEVVMAQTGALALRSRLFGEMSAGQQRRIQIARALVASAGCLLLDEPSNGLDLYAQHELREILIALAAQGTTMLLITHQLADIVPQMQRVVMMREGRIVADGTRQELLTEARLSELFSVPVRLETRDNCLFAF